MRKFTYKLTFSPYSNTLRAKNIKDAWKKLRKTWPEYNIKKVIEYLH